jgi:quinol monooxygenase YgiN
MAAPEGRRDDLVAALRALVEAARAEDGTLVYALHESATEADVVWFYELYHDDEAMSAHSGSEAMKTIGAGLAGLLGGRPELHFLRLVEGKGLPDSA